MPRSLKPLRSDAGNASPDMSALLLADTGNQSLAAACTPVTRATIARARKQDKWFATAYDDALEIYSDVLEAELIRRALKGVKKPVFQKGLLIGHERVYSDSLMMLAIKAKRPEYKDKLALDAHIKGGVLVVAQQAADSKEWEERYGDLQRPSSQAKEETKKENDKEKRIVRF